MTCRNSQVVQWLGLCALTAEGKKKEMTFNINQVLSELHLAQAENEFLNLNECSVLIQYFLNYKNNCSC